MTNKNIKSNFSILFIDDEVKSTKYFKKIFEKDFNIITSIETDEAWDIIEKRSNEIAVIVSDQRMPVATGVELLNKVKEKYPNIVRILTTAYSNLNDNIAAINQSNVFGYLSKPWELEKVKVMLDKAFDKFETNLTLRSLGGSIAHEVRNPLNTVNLSLNQIKDYIENARNKCQMDCLESQVEEMVSVAFSSIKRANELIDIILHNTQGKEIDPHSFLYLNTKEVLRKVIREYGYKNNNERKMILLDDTNENDNFIFKGDETLFVYVLFNLIKNALYYQDYRDNFHITISTSTSPEGNFIKVRDNGPGVPKDRMEIIFENFITSGKQGGTGLGLPFCRRVMKSFKGDIACDSIAGEYTEFSLFFPNLTDKEIKDATLEMSLSKHECLNKALKIMLIANDSFGQETHNHIKQFFKNANIDISCNTKEISHYLENTKEGFNIIAVQSSILPHIENSIFQKIQNSNQGTPVILLNDSQNSLIGANTKLEVSSNSYHESLIRALCKWNFLKYVPLTLSQKNDKPLKGKKILLADDELTNLTILSRILQNEGAEVNTALDGEELYQKYIENTYDLVISDINMPKLSGKEAVRKIRQHDLALSKYTPIISYGGNSEKEQIYRILKSGMDDYFIKGDDTKYLISLIQFWISL